jgi:hypothetical protein
MFGHKMIKSGRGKGMNKPANKPVGDPMKPVRMAKGGMVPPFLQNSDKGKAKKMASKAMAKGKKMMPAFMKKGAR